MKLIIYSNSTKKYAEDLVQRLKEGCIKNINDIAKPEPQNKYDTIIGIGGGKVIDCAKIVAGNNRAVAIPTTASGAAATSHAVYWDKKTKKKIDIKTKKPIILINEKYLKNIPTEILLMTSYDALGHALDSFWSKNATEQSKELAIEAYKKIKEQIINDFFDVLQLIQAGNVAGEAIEITGTNMTHAISYPLTAIYGIPHGMAVGWAIKPSMDHQQCKFKPPNLNRVLQGINEDGDFIQTVAREAMTYEKIHNANEDITEEKLIKLLEGYI